MNLSCVSDSVPELGWVNVAVAWGVDGAKGATPAGQLVRRQHPRCQLAVVELGEEGSPLVPILAEVVRAENPPQLPHSVPGAYQFEVAEPAVD